LVARSATRWLRLYEQANLDRVNMERDTFRLIAK
jgi:hypothetical protein